MKVGSFLRAVDHDRIVEAIRRAESRCTAELRVHVAKGAVDDPEKAAIAVFEKLGMTATRDRNGVLVFIAPSNQKFAIIGDSGIDARCGEGFWKDVAAAMAEDFRDSRFTDGIVNGVTRAGEALARHFPRVESHVDVNELPDEVSEE